MMIEAMSMDDLSPRHLQNNNKKIAKGRTLLKVEAEQDWEGVTRKIRGKAGVVYITKLKEKGLSIQRG